MRSVLQGQLSVSVDDSLLFSRLSGDYNPLHVDPVIARRTPFGGTVAHGIHLFLHTLDFVASHHVLDDHQPASLAATFNAPVRSGCVFSVRAIVDGASIRLTAEMDGSPAFTGSVSLTPAVVPERPVDDADFGWAPPQTVSFPPTLNEGSVPLRSSRALLALLFPSLAKLASTSWITDVLATTQIVGMRCPGLHSIYSGFRLRGLQMATHSSQAMRYRVDGVDHRFQLVRIQVTGVCLGGTIETFFRPPPVAQRSMNEVAPAVIAGEFAGQRALVIGGSRGLGELTAKVLAAGGADVAITYARGKEDAERVSNEVCAHGHSCVPYQMDMATSTTTAPPEWLTHSHFSHVYYFASPPISRSLGEWNEPRFRQFTQTYVTAFAALVEQTVAARKNQKTPMTFLYPSSIFVAQAEPGFAEYAVAKAAGEALCDQLTSRHDVRFAKPRLPRMRTDQTNSLVDTGATDPFPIILHLLRKMHSAEPKNAGPVAEGTATSSRALQDGAA